MLDSKVDQIYMKDHDEVQIYKARTTTAVVSDCRPGKNGNRSIWGPEKVVRNRRTKDGQSCVFHKFVNFKKRTTSKSWLQSFRWKRNSPLTCTLGVLNLWEENKKVDTDRHGVFFQVRWNQRAKRKTDGNRKQRGRCHQAVSSNGESRTEWDRVWAVHTHTHTHKRTHEMVKVCVDGEAKVRVKFVGRNWRCSSIRTHELLRTVNRQSSNCARALYIYVYRLRVWYRSNTHTHTHWSVPTSNECAQLLLCCFRWRISSFFQI